MSQPAIAKSFLYLIPTRQQYITCNIFPFFSTLFYVELHCSYSHKKQARVDANLNECDFKIIFKVLILTKCLHEGEAKKTRLRIFAIKRYQHEWKGERFTLLNKKVCRRLAGSVVKMRLYNLTVQTRRRKKLIQSTDVQCVLFLFAYQGDDHINQSDLQSVRLQDNMLL